MMDKILYKEEQRVGRNGLWLILLITPAVIISLLIYQRITGRVVFDHTLGDLPLIIISICYLIPAVFSLSVIRLSIIIDDQKIRYGWNVPSGQMNEIKLEEIAECRVVKYKFVGYGFRTSHKYGMIYNVIGNKGLQIVRKTGRNVLIGTNNAEELKKVIQQLKLGA